MGYYKVIEKDGRFYPALVVEVQDGEDVSPFQDPCQTREEAQKIVDDFNVATGAK